MKKTIFTLAVTMFAAVTFFTSCNSPAEKVEASKDNVIEAQQKLEKAKQEYAEQYIKFKFESDEKITANEKLIADLKAYSKTKKKEAKIEYEKTISDLEAKNQTMREKVRDYHEENLDNWESFKNEFNHDMNEIGKSINDLGKDNVK